MKISISNLHRIWLADPWSWSPIKALHMHYKSMIKPFFIFLEGDGQGQFSIDAVHVFRSLAPKDKIFRFRFEKTKEVLYPLKIDLFADESCDKTIAQILIERGYVKVIRSDNRLNL